MRCNECNAAELAPVRIVYERACPYGGKFSTTAEGFECPGCGSQLIPGYIAERISSEWHRLESTGRLRKGGPGEVVFSEAGRADKRRAMDIVRAIKTRLRLNL